MVSFDGAMPLKGATMASKAVEFITTVYNVCSRELQEMEISPTPPVLAESMAESLLEWEDFEAYNKTPRGKHAVKEILSTWGAERKEFAELAARLYFPKPPKPKPQTSPVAPQPVPVALTPDGGMVLNGRTFSARQLKFFMEVSAAYLRCKKEAGG